MDFFTESELEDGSLGKLIERLGQTLSRPPLNEDERRARAIEARLLMSGIEEAGVDATALLRLGMADTAWLPIFVLLIVTPESERVASELPIDYDGWLKALSMPELPFTDPEAAAEAIPEGDLEVGSAELIDFVTSGPIADFTRRVVAILPRWVLLAGIDDILLMEPPSVAALSVVDGGTASEQAVEEYRWLWERFGREGFDQWADSSLRLEFMWREEQWSPPFPIDELVVDRSSDPSLHLELARRSVRGGTDDGELLLRARLQQQALGFLQQQRFTEAAALFEFYLHQAPTDEVARNNLGFCLMPHRPELALHHLQRVNLRASGMATLVVHNVCTALAVLGRDAEALDRAEYHWQRERQPKTSTAYLWRENEDGLELFFANDSGVAFAELGLRLAERVEVADRIARWSERVVEASRSSDAKK